MVQTLLRSLILSMRDRHEQEAQALGSKARVIYERVVTQYPAFAALELESLIKVDPLVINFLDRGKFLVLTPPDNEEPMVPVITIRCDFTTMMPEFRVRLALFRIGDGGNLQAVGYRFETPEGDGSHDYYHAQFIKELEKGRPRCTLPCPDFFPTTQPAVALDAHDPLTLLICVMVSLYGSDYVRRELRGVAYSNELDSFVRRMIWHRNQPSYWSVDVPQGAATVSQVMQTKMDPKRFKLVMKAEGARNIRKSTRDDFLAQRQPPA